MNWRFLLLGFVALGLAAQTGAPLVPATKDAVDEEASALSTALAEAGNSPADFIRALETHLAKYPNAPKRNEIERALAKSAMETKDDKRIILYGERVLKRDPEEVALLDRVARAYLVNDDKVSAAKGLSYAQKFEAAINDVRKKPMPGHMKAAEWQDDLDRATSRALLLQSRATGNLGDMPFAIALAKKSWESYPTAECAREWAKWVLASGDALGAVEHYAQAFTLEDPRSTEADRAKDRRRMGELFTKVKGSEAGLGDVILKAYDECSGLMADRLAKMKAQDPNAQAGSILDFTLPGVNTPELKLSSLKGKTVVMDFWATWCVPCRKQRPLYQQVEAKFKDRGDVVFLAVNTDEERELVAPFLKEQKWDNPVYFDAGLGDYAKVTSIPTTIVIDRQGAVSSRMNGFLPDRFVDLLTKRIEETFH